LALDQISRNKPVFNGKYNVPEVLAQNAISPDARVCADIILSFNAVNQMMVNRQIKELAKEKDVVVRWRTVIGPDGVLRKSCIRYDIGGGSGNFDYDMYGNKIDHEMKQKEALENVVRQNEVTIISPQDKISLLLQAEKQMVSLDKVVLHDNMQTMICLCVDIQDVRPIQDEDSCEINDASIYLIPSFVQQED
jgi:hypothetical protein